MLSPRIKIFPTDADISGRQRIKFGIDPTSAQLHLGHLVPIRVVKKLMAAGHQATIVLGTFTAQLGDPSGQDKTRPLLAAETVSQNAEKIIVWLRKFLGVGEYTFMRNAGLHGSTKLSDFLNTISKFTVHRALSRDAFQARQEAGQPIGLHELLVPFLQGQDSVFLRTEIEIGGTDQLFNFQVARELQIHDGQKPQNCILCPIINGTDGRKMSKSLGNCIFLEDTPEDIFGKTMSIPDEQTDEWIELLSDVTATPDHPMQKKKLLAFDIVRQLHGDLAAAEALEHFQKVVERGEEDKPVPVEASTLLDAVVKIRGSSKNEARRVIEQGGAEINKVKTIDPNAQVEKGQIIRAGKRQFGVIQ